MQFVGRSLIYNSLSILIILSIIYSIIYSLYLFSYVIQTSRP